MSEATSGTGINSLPGCRCAHPVLQELAMFPEEELEKKKTKSRRARQARRRPMPLRQGRLRDRRAGALSLRTIIRRRVAARSWCVPCNLASEAGATASASPRARPASRAMKTRPPRPHEASARAAARRSSTNARARRARSTSPVRFSGCRTGRQAALSHRDRGIAGMGAYTGEPLVPPKGYPGVVWRSKKKKRADRGDGAQPCVPQAAQCIYFAWGLVFV